MKEVLRQKMLLELSGGHSGPPQQRQQQQQQQQFGIAGNSMRRQYPAPPSEASVGGDDASTELVGMGGAPIGRARHAQQTIEGLLGNITAEPNIVGEQSNLYMSPPLTTRAEDAAPQYMPQGAQYMPQGAQYMPQGAQYMPQGAQFMPQAQYMPQGVQYMPQGAQHMPQGSQHMPQGAQFMPQAQYMPQGAQYMPQGAQHMPQGAQHMPQGAQHMPQGAQYTQHQAQAQVCSEYDDDDEEEYEDEDEEYDDGDEDGEQAAAVLSSNDIGIVIDGSFGSSLQNHGQGGVAQQEKDSEGVQRKIKEEKAHQRAEAKREAEVKREAEAKREAGAKTEAEAKREAEAKKEAEAQEAEAKAQEEQKTKEEEEKAKQDWEESTSKDSKEYLSGTAMQGTKVDPAAAQAVAVGTVVNDGVDDASIPAAVAMAQDTPPSTGHRGSILGTPAAGPVKSSAASRKADKWRKVRVHLQDQHIMVKKLWKHTMDKDDTGLIDFKEFRLYVQFALHNADYEYCNRLDERLQSFFIRISKSEHIAGKHEEAVRRWRQDRTLNFIDEHGLLKDPAWPFYKEYHLGSLINGPKLLTIMNTLREEWSDVEDRVLIDLLDRYKNPNPLQQRSRLKTEELWNAIDKSIPNKGIEACKLRMRFHKLQQSLHENAFISYLFLLFDPNDSGQLTFDEFVQGAMHHGLDSHGRLGVCKPCPGPDRKGYPKHHGDVVGPLAFNMEVTEGKTKKKLLLSFNSLAFLSHTNILRKCMLWLIKFPAFDMIILVAILCNSIVLAMEDYTDPDRENNPTLNNRIVDGSELTFTIIFTFECAVKIIALGFVSFPTAYMKDNWNVIDFFVVLAGLVGMIPGFPQLSSLRTIKVLRPLRSISRLPGMRRLVGSLLNALPGLFTCVMLLMGCFIIFGILGVQLWQGKLHFACRKTPYPVDGTWEYTDEVRVCSTNPNSGFQCWNGTYCGSEYEPPAGHPMSLPLPLAPEDLNFGLTTFDNIGYAAITIFQIITMENWSMIMYHVQDSQHSAAGLYFVFLLIFGSFFLLNMILAVIWEKFNDFNSKGDSSSARVSERPEEEEENQHRDPKSLSPGVTARKGSSARKGSVFGGVMRKMSFAGSPAAQDVVATTQPGQVLPVAAKEARRQSVGGAYATGEVAAVPVNQTPSWQKNPACCICRIVRSFVHHEVFDSFIMVCIITNTMTLALDEYPEDPERVKICEGINYVLTMIFICEMGLKLIGLGIPEYFSDGMNMFDATIVVASITELITEAVAPSGEGSSGGGPIGALRAFRVFRVFKLARKWKSLQRLLTQVGGTIMESGNFALLLFLFIFIFSLVGMQFFAKRYMFDGDTGEAVKWEPFKYNDTTPPHAMWSKERPYDTSRTNFDDLMNAFLAVFQVLSGEDWNNVQYDAMRGVDIAGGFIYFLMLTVLGSYIVLNLFLAILLGNSPEGEGEEEDDDYVVDYDMKKANMRRFEDAILDLPFLAVMFITESSSASASKMLEADWSKVAGELHGMSDIKPGECTLAKFTINDDEGRKFISDRFNVNTFPSIKIFEDGVHRSYTGPRNKPMKMRHAIAKEQRKYQIVAAERDPTGAKIAPVFDSDDENDESDDDEALHRQSELQGVSLFLFDHHSFFRKCLFKLMKMQLFENVILVAILVSSCCLAVDTPLIDPESAEKKTLDFIDFVLVVLFIVEMCIRIISLNLTAYLSDGWNLLDFSIVMISIVDLLPISIGSVTILRALRALRALRPLRMISRAPGMKKVVDTMLQTIPSAVNVLVVCSLFFLIFGIVGVGFFKGRFGYCEGLGDDGNFGDVQVKDFLPHYNYTMSMHSYAAKVAQHPGLTDKDNVTHYEYASAAINNETIADLVNGTFGIYVELYKKPFTRADCEFFGSSWGNAAANFDNVVNAMLLLLEISTTEGWVDYMYNGVDSTGIDQHPVRGFNRTYAWYFVLWIVVGNFFIINLFVGAVCDQFNELGDSGGETDMFQTEAQKEWVETQMQISRCRLKKELDKPPGVVRRMIFHFVQTTAFEMGIMACIVCNTLLMACSYYQQSDEYTFGIEIVNYIFASVFTVELILKMLGLGPAQYFANWWNCFDFLVVMGTNISVLLTVGFNLNIGPVASLARAFRMCQMGRMLKNANRLQSLIDTIIQNLPYMSNITAVLFLVLFIFAVMGMQLFASVTYLAPGATMNEHAHFQDFMTAFITLFRCTTGEAWNSIMHDLMITKTADSTAVFTAADHEAFWTLDTDAVPTSIAFTSCYTGSSTQDDYNAYKMISGALNRPSATIGCSPGYTVTVVYFMLFLVFCSFILLNLFLAVILQGFATSDEENSAVLPPAVLKALKMVWSEIDRKATYHIRADEVEGLFRRLDQELRLNKTAIPPLGLSGAVLKSSYGVELEYEHFDEKLIKRFKKQDKQFGKKAKEDAKKGNGFVVKYGSKLTLRHNNSKGLLQSFYAVKSNPHQIVSCSAGDSDTSGKKILKRASDKTTWIVRAPSTESVQGRVGEEVRNGDSIRLQHVETNRFLTVCDGAAPITVPPNPKASEHQNVVGTNLDESASNENDDWMIELTGRDDKEPWQTGFQARFISNTGNMLHSHERSQPGRTDRQLTACVQKSLENLWQVEELITGHGEPGLRRQELCQFIISLDLEDVVHVPVKNPLQKDTAGGFDAGCVHFIDVTKKLAKQVHFKQNQRRGHSTKSLDDMDIQGMHEDEAAGSTQASKRGQNTADAYMRTGYTWQERWAVRTLQNRCRLHMSMKELLRRRIAKEKDLLPWDPTSCVKEMAQEVASRRAKATAKNANFTDPSSEATATKAAAQAAVERTKEEAKPPPGVPLYSARTAKLIDEERGGEPALKEQPLYSARTVQLIGDEARATMQYSARTAALVQTGAAPMSARTAKLLQQQDPSMVARQATKETKAAELPPLKLPPSGRNVPLSSRGVTGSALVTGRRAEKDRHIAQLQERIADIELAEKSRKIAELQAKLASLVGPPR
jgi:hypothetical protein